jgi:hypothetical protein
MSIKTGDTVPNIPPVSVRQIVRYLGKEYAYRKRSGDRWMDIGKASHTSGDNGYADYCLATAEKCYHEADMVRKILVCLKIGSVAKIGG